MQPVTFRLPAGQGSAVVLGRIRRFLEGLPTDQAFDVTVQQHKQRRSNQQNAYLWGVVYPAILSAGGETLRGWTAADLHEYCLGECFGWERVVAFGRARLRPVRRSSVLNKQEFTDFIESIRARMGEHGITIPEANEHG